MSAGRTRRFWCVVSLVVSVAGITADISAQAEPGIRIYDEQLRVALDRRRPTDREMGFDAGGWMNYTLLSFDDDANQRDRTLNQFQLRGWASANLKNVHKAYFRGLLNWDVWAGGDNLGFRDCRFTESVERAWYEFNLDKLIQQQSGTVPTWDFSVKAGREYTTIGSGLALSMPLDAVDIRYRYKNFHARALLGNTIVDSRNRVDVSGPIASHQDRCFWGFELKYRFPNHQPFAYLLSQSDHSSPDPPNPVQKYDYSSRYLGIGSTGSLLSADLSYRAELVGEWGRTYSFGQRSSQDPICAMAGNIELEYLFRVRTHPRVSFAYIYASGDNDRQIANATFGGNTAGTRDRAFNGFGFRDTGLSFAPAMSNLHMFSLGARFFPLEEHELFRKMELGTKVFFYQKDKKDGGISDTGAVDQANWLGWEWDVFCNWRITSDLSWTGRYGVFMPGAAFRGQRDAPRHFLYTGLLMSF